MHDYAIFGHDRSTIGRWLGFSSIAIAGGIAQFLVFAASMTGIEAFIKATVTTGAIYFALDWIFNKYAWKIPFFSIPDLNGIWKIQGNTLDEDGNTKYAWEGELGITQNWKTILIHLKTQNSQSKSYTATLSKCHEPSASLLLSYSYRNEPELEQSHELNPHRGFCEIEIDKGLKTAKAAYFNSRGRRTFGVMSLTKEQK